MRHTQEQLDQIFEQIQSGEMEKAFQCNIAAGLPYPQKATLQYDDERGQAMIVPVTNDDGGTTEYAYMRSPGGEWEEVMEDLM